MPICKYFEVSKMLWRDEKQTEVTQFIDAHSYSLVSFIIYIYIRIFSIGLQAK